jgi:hypothetical protein
MQSDDERVERTHAMDGAMRVVDAIDALVLISIDISDGLVHAP